MWEEEEFPVLGGVARGGLIQQMTLSKNSKKIRRLTIWIYWRIICHAAETSRAKNSRQEHDWRD